MKKMLAMALALLMVAVLLPVTAMAAEAPTWASSVNFDAATVVYYTVGGTVVKEGTADQYTPVVAYKVDSGSNIAYAADLRAAMMNGASEVFCKENATVSTVGAHTNVTKSITIYANNANFGGGDLSIYANGSAKYPAPTEKNVTISIYNAKNLVVWGEPQNVGRVWNVNFYDCVNEGSNFFMYRGNSDRTDKINLFMSNCKASGFNDSTVHTTADGTVVIENCEFSNNCAPVNIAHKQSGTIEVTVRNSSFTNCGKEDQSDDYFAPIRVVNNNAQSEVVVKLADNTFVNTVGTNGDVLLGDHRTKNGAAKPSYDVNATIKTTQDITVKSGDANSNASYEVKANTTVAATANGRAPEIIKQDPTTPGTITIIVPSTPTSPEFLSGANQTVGVGAKATFRIDKDFVDFMSVAVDGITLDKTQYKAWSGSTYVELLSSYMKTLSEGTHTLSAYFNGATATTAFTISKTVPAQQNPATGANDFVGAAAALAVVSLLGIAAVTRKK